MIYDKVELYQVVGNALQMKVVPVDLSDVFRVTAATLLPFVPVVLAVVPADKAIALVAKLLMN